MSKLNEILSGLGLNESKSVELNGKQFRITKKWGNFQDVSSLDAIGLSCPSDLATTPAPTALLVSADEESCFHGDADNIRALLGDGYVEEKVSHLAFALFSFLSPQGAPVPIPEVLSFDASLFVLRSHHETIPLTYAGSSVVNHYSGLLKRWSGAEGFHFLYESSGQQYKTRDYLNGFEDYVVRSILSPSIQGLARSPV